MTGAQDPECLSVVRLHRQASDTHTSVCGKRLIKHKKYGPKGREDRQTIRGIWNMNQTGWIER